MSLDQNISLEYGGVRFEECLLSFMELCLRTGTPKMQQICMTLVQDYCVAFRNEPMECTVGYIAKRSTYGRQQHLNVYEEFTMFIKGKPQYHLYSEYADDPHHNVDAINKRRDITELDYQAIDDAFRNNPVAGALTKVFEKIKLYADKIMIEASGDPVYTFWFKHGSGESCVGIDLREIIKF